MTNYTVVCDGGSSGNHDIAIPSFGYGSFIVSTERGTSPIHQKSYGEGVTNNQAEYMALIDALEFLKGVCQGGAMEASEVHIEVKMDSRLVIGQMFQGHKVKNEKLKLLNARAKELASVFGSVSFIKIPRTEMVQTLGH